MNVFEDLIEELKEENLLEETVIGTNQEVAATPEAESVEEVLSEFQDVFNDEAARILPASISIEPSDGTSENDALINDSSADTKFPDAAPPTNKADFYTKRATEEVTGLQTVEHVFSGVEREQMKMMPKPYDDLECKKALHAFLQISQKPNTPEHARAEFHLMQETESWYSALSHRDKNISVTHLRRYCETTRPVLSSTALISMARFYRNAPFSEQVRNKFDLILTRLFTKEIANDKRELSVSRAELIKYVSDLYSQWASISLYAASEDDSDILIITLKFEDFMAEADSANNFDELVKNDFFNRLRNFKETTNENFFAPLVTATAIECNVRIGNRYVDLIQAEKQKVEKEILEDKYGFLHDQAISESSSKTLQLVQLLRQKAELPKTEPQKPVAVESVQIKSQISAKVPKVEKKTPLKVNKWLLTATILVVVVNIGLYFWMNSSSAPEKNQQSVEKVNLENSTLRDFVKEARITSGTFYGIVQPNWSELDKSKKEDVLKKIFSTADEKAFSKAHLLDQEGKSVGYIDALKTQVY